MKLPLHFAYLLTFICSYSKYTVVFGNAFFFAGVVDVYVYANAATPKQTFDFQEHCVQGFSASNLAFWKSIHLLIVNTSPAWIAAVALESREIFHVFICESQRQQSFVEGWNLM